MKVYGKEEEQSQSVQPGFQNQSAMPGGAVPLRKSWLGRTCKRCGLGSGIGAGEPLQISGSQSSERRAT